MKQDPVEMLRIRLCKITRWQSTVKMHEEGQYMGGFRYNTVGIHIDKLLLRYLE